MTVGIFRSRIFTAGRAFLRDGRGVSAVETAFAFPVILAAFFIIVEFANMALTIQVGESAVSSALLRFRDAGELGGRPPKMTFVRVLRPIHLATSSPRMSPA